MQLTIIAVGKLKETYWREAIAEYSKRLAPYAKLEIIEIEESRLPDRPGPAEIAQGLRKEGRVILKNIKVTDYLITLELDKTMWTSEMLAAKMQACFSGGRSSIVYVIGGSYGLSDEVKKRADDAVTLSKMTFPHQLVRVIWLEQLYRAFKILNNETYHK